MLEVKHLTKSFGNMRAVDDVSFTVERGQILGFLGPNGAGKSTTMNMITGYLASTSGTAIIDGVDILKDPVKAKAKIGYLPERPPLYLDMTVREYLNFMYELKLVKLPRKEHLTKICQRVQISDVYAHQKPIQRLPPAHRHCAGSARQSRPADFGRADGGAGPQADHRYPQPHQDAGSKTDGDPVLPYPARSAGGVRPGDCY